jgi:hydrogenase-4 component E
VTAAQIGDVVARGQDAAVAAIILLGVGMAVARSIGLSTLLLAAQSVLLGLGAIAIGLDRGSLELIGGGLLTIALRGFVLPIVLRRLLHRSPVRHETNAYLGRRTAALAAVVIVFASVIAVEDVSLSLKSGPPMGLAAAIAEVLTGLLVIATRRKSLSMVIGLLVFENGIALAAISLTAGMPFVMELGASFDLLLVMIVVQVHARRMLTTFGSLSTDRLRSLRG